MGWTYKCREERDEGKGEGELLGSKLSLKLKMGEKEKSKKSEKEGMLRKMVFFFFFFFSWQLWRMALLWTASILFSRLLLLFTTTTSPPSSSSSSSSSPSSAHARAHGDGEGEGEGFERRICVVTGATSGLGKAAAIQLASHGFHLFLAARNSRLLFQTVQEIKELGHHYVEAIQLDLSSYISIKNFQLSLKQRLSHLGFHHSIQLLVNNAGILATSFRESPDGFDE